MSKEEAERVLNAVQSDEDSLQKDKMKRVPGSGGHQKPW
jgi:hypothetical protein